MQVWVRDSIADPAIGPLAGRFCVSSHGCCALPLSFLINCVRYVCAMQCYMHRFRSLLFRCAGGFSHFHSPHAGCCFAAATFAACESVDACGYVCRKVRMNALLHVCCPSCCRGVVVCMRAQAGRTCLPAPTTIHGPYYRTCPVSIIAPSITLHGATRCGVRRLSVRGRDPWQQWDHVCSQAHLCCSCRSVRHTPRMLLPLH